MYAYKVEFAVRRRLETEAQFFSRPAVGWVLECPNPMSMMWRLLTAMMLLAASIQAAESPQRTERSEHSLKLALEGEWSELIVAEMINQGGMAPIYGGLRITRSADGLSISPWQEDETMPGLSLGAARPYDASLLPKFTDSIVRHYAAALASKDIYEHIAESEDAEERKKAWEGASYLARGTPVGGFPAAGIDVRITTHGRQVRFENSFGDKSSRDFWKWLVGNGALRPTDFDAAGSPLQPNTPEEKLSNALEGDWSNLSVTAIHFPGCVGPFYTGLQVTRTATGFSVSTSRVGPGDSHSRPIQSAAKPFDPALLPKFTDSIVRHYAAALASKSIHEYIAELKDAEERKKAWAGYFSLKGRPIGGVPWAEIVVSVTTSGRTLCVQDHYGDASFSALCDWLSEHGAGWK